jgi:hypothetical protein
MDKDIQQITSLLEEIIVRSNKEAQEIFKSYVNLPNGEECDRLRRQRRKTQKKANFFRAALEKINKI